MPLLTPPAGSRLEVRADGATVRVRVPRRGLAMGHLLPAVVATGLLAFGVVAPLTQRSRLEALLVLVIALPIFIVGAVMWLAVARSAGEEQELELGSDRLLLRRGRRVIAIPYAAIDAIGLQEIDIRRPAALWHLARPSWEGGRLQLPVIEHADGVTTFAESARPEEARWLVAVLQEHVAAR
ncbi:MAG TPA: hypothetical protein VGQ83_37035 [Polyangia bacterium]|jgi:hypothetical protein